MTAREISEARTRLGVVLLRDCAIPELLRVKHRIDARTDPEKGRLETVAWIKRLRDMRRLAEKQIRAKRQFLQEVLKEVRVRGSNVTLTYKPLSVGSLLH